jgi:zinc transport system substrate-binding protein
MKNIRIIIIFFFCVILLAVIACKKADDRQTGPKKIKIVTTLFPLYDFTKNIGGEYVDVNLLLPPGVEAHSFEPRPEDIIRINNADIFVYTGKYMEPWVEKILKGVDNKSLVVVDSSEGVTLLEDISNHNHSHKHNHEIDPHIWLDFENAKIMVNNILKSIINVDLKNEKYYQENAERYKKELSNIDQAFKDGLALCKTRYFIHGGHFTFGYMAKRYGLKYISAFEGFSPDTEPSVKKLANLVKEMRKHNIKYIFSEEIISPKVSEMISRETGAQILKLHAAHNLTKDEWDKGVTFMELMRENLLNLRIGLQCQ